MPNPIRMLIVEDNPDDAELLLLELSRGGLEIDWRRVETADQMRAALADVTWDIVLSDYTLPGFGALEALALTRKVAPDMPFVIVSGTIGEEKAVEAMRAGASDYLLKSSLIRLVPAIERELREAEGRRARRTAEQAAYRLAAIVQSSDDAILGKTLEGTLTDWNAGAERLYGWSAQEAVGRHISLIVPPDRIKEADAVLARLQRGERVEPFETVRVHRDGTRIDVSITASPVRDREGRLVGVSKTARDIRPRKRAEEERRRLVYDLGERVKELTALHHLARLLQGPSPDLPTLLEQAAALLPPALRFPEMVAARVTFGDLEAVTPGFRQTPWRLAATFVTTDGLQGLIEVVYLQQTPETEVDPFLAEERSLLHSFAEMLRGHLDRRRAEEALRLSEARFRAVVEEGWDSVTLIDVTGTVLYTTPSTTRVLGYAPEEFLGRNGLEFVHPDDLESTGEFFTRILAMPGGSATTSYRYQCRDGTWRWVEAAVTNLLADPHVRAIVLNCRDVTEQRGAERRLRSVTDNAPVLLAQIDRQTRYSFVNRPYAARFSQGPEGLIGKHISEILGEGAYRTISPHVEAALAGQRVEFETEVPYPGQITQHVHCAYEPEFDAEGRPDGFVAAITNVTAWRQAEQSLRENEERLRQVIESNLVGVFFWEESGGVVDANDAYLDMIGYSRDDLRAGRVVCTVITPPEYHAIDERAMAEMAAEGRCRPFEKEYLRKDGSRVPVLIMGAYLHGKPKNGVAFALDLSPQKKAQREAAEHLALLETLLGNAPVGFAFIDPQFRFARCNEALAAMNGIPAAAHLGRLVSEVVPQLWPRLEPIYRQVIQSGLAQPGVELSGETAATPGQSRHYHVSLYPVRVGGALLGVGVVVVDLTDRRTLEEQFRQAQKMEAVGQLAGGVAHDFNNLLTIISGYSDLLLQRLQQGDPNRSLAEEIHRAGERSAALTRQLLVFSRKQVVQPRILDLNELVADTQKMLRRIIGEDVHLEATLKPLAGRVKADPSQLEQVLMNLAVNARDAMPTGGRLTIETYDVNLGEDYARRHTEVHPGSHVLLEVSDTGCGMTEEVKARLFEPFFTTKEPGKGSGLGLAVVHGIIKQAGGHIEVCSEAGKGTTFKVYLPCVIQPAQPSKLRSDLKPPPRGNETVLVVEDEDGVRTLTRHILHSCGYRVLEAADGNEALQLASRYQGVIHLLITDVVMPGGLGGRLLAERFHGLYPNAQVMYVSGYTDDAVVRHGVLEDNVQFLQKPFSPMVLARMVREVLDSAGGTGK